MQSPTSADYVSLQILIHDLVWDLGCSPQTLLIFLPRLLQRWTEVVHDCQHRVTNEIEWVSAGWFHYYGPRMDFSAFFLNGAVPGSFLDHLWRMLGSLQTKTNKFDHPVFTGRRSLETRGAPSASSGRAETVSVSPPRAQTFRESFLRPPCFEILDSPPRNMRSKFVDADPRFDAHDTLPWDVTETTDDATWARLIEIYGCECDDTWMK